MTLPGSDLESVQLFIYWLCKHDLPDMTKEEDSHTNGTPERRDCITKNQEILVRLWCFGDRFLVPRLQNVAMKNLIHRLRGAYVRAEIVDLALRLTLEKSPLRNAITRHFLHNQPANGHANAYGGLQYDQADFERFGSTPGLMTQFLRVISKSVRKRLPCTCEKECYRINEVDEKKFMVAE